MSRQRRSSTLSVITAILAVVSTTVSFAQIEEEELLEPQTAVTATSSDQAFDSSAVELLYAEARSALGADDQPAALLLFGQIVDTIDAHLQDRLAAAEIARAKAEAEAAAAEAAEAAAAEAEAAAQDPSGETAGELLDEAIAEQPAEEGTESEAEAAADSEAAEDGEASEEETEPIPEPPEPASEIRFLDPQTRDLLIRSLGYRAGIQLTFGEEDLARQSLERMLTIDPGAGIDRESASSELLELSDGLSRRLVGDLTLLVEPPDAVVTVDGRVVDANAGPVSALSGQRWLSVERVGYQASVEEIEVRAGRQKEVEVVLERVAPVLRLHTRPNDAEVFIDGQLVAVTEGAAAEDFLRHGRYPREEFSAELILADVEPGFRLLEVRKAGYRGYRSELRIEELIDYPMPPVVLEREAGTLVFRDLPADATILIDGRPTRIENPGSSRPRITLEPGEHEAQVTSASSRMFQNRFFLADRQTVEVKVRLLPGVAFLGVLGRGGEVAANLSKALKVALGDQGKWAVLDRSADGPRVLAAAGATAESLAAYSDDRDERLQAPRTGSLPPPAREGAVDWRRVQQATDDRAPGMLYVAAVLVEDLLERDARIFVWPSAPGPAIPDVIKLPLGEPGAANRLGAAFHRQPALRTPWFGALLIDGAAGPVIADVTPGSPAEAAGFTVGDQILDVDRIVVSSSSDFEQRLATAGAGTAAAIALRSATGEARTAELNIGSSPWIRTEFGRDTLDSVVFTDLELMAESATTDDLWLIRTMQALLLLQAGEAEEAVRRLRGVNAPQSSHGVSQATVDYWLALALEATGSDYRDATRALLEKAAGLEGARLFRNDGAFLAPRAKSRLRSLGFGE